MLYGIFNRCTALREVTTGLLAWEHRIQHLGINYHPRRSTISDANSSRPAEVFESIYYWLYHRYKQFLPDSQSKKEARLYIADSTTIQLFQEVLKNAGRNPVEGRRKGGIKVHTLMGSLVMEKTVTDIDETIDFTNLPGKQYIIFMEDKRKFKNHLLISRSVYFQ